MGEIVETLESMFREKGEGRVEMPPKPGIHTRPDSFLHAMPAWLPAAGAAGMKWVGGYPENQAKGLPYVTGLFVLNDPDTGLPIAVMDCTWLTAMRTAAATGVAAKHLARPGSRTAGIVACGVQGRSHLEALASLFPLERVHAYDRHREVAEEFARTMQPRCDVEIQVVESAREAVQGLDLVVTSGPILRDPDPAIEAGWLAPGAFASAVDFDSYFRGDALREADLLVTDDVPQMEHYREIGYFSDTPEVTCELGDIVCGRAPGRAPGAIGDQQRAIAMNLGIALDDVATAVRIHARALDLGVGTRLPL